MFHVQSFNPHPLLRHCVDSYLIVSTDQQEGNYAESSLLPNITQNLVLGLDEGNTVYDCNHSTFTSQHFIAGPNDGVCHVRFFSGMKKMVIHFKPGGFYKIFQLPAYYFSNQTRDAVEFLGKPLIDLTHQLKKTSLYSKIELADAFLLNYLRKDQKKTDRNIDEALRLIEKSRGNISLRELELATYTTKRTLERYFLEQVGLFPKTYSRLVRFGGVIRSIESNLNVKWRQLADAFGFYDQSHFNNEFKSLTGGSPQDYFLSKTGYEKIMQA
ncbi:MAG TPA: AraC family transcriptional regulator [Puia sp.]|nr:AraC family transcriptional regulator [Puia sp.]